MKSAVNGLAGYRVAEEVPMLPLIPATGALAWTVRVFPAQQERFRIRHGEAVILLGAGLPTDSTTLFPAFHCTITGTTGSGLRVAGRAAQEGSNDSPETSSDTLSREIFWIREIRTAP